MFVITKRGLLLVGLLVRAMVVLQWPWWSSGRCVMGAYGTEEAARIGTRCTGKRLVLMVWYVIWDVSGWLFNSFNMMGTPLFPVVTLARLYDYAAHLTVHIMVGTRSG